MVFSFFHITEQQYIKIMKIHRCFLLLFLFPLFSFAQYSEVGILLGGALYRGDLTHRDKLVNLSESHFAYGAFFRYNLSDFISFKLSVQQGKLSGNDAYAKDTNQRNRNLHFKTNLTEVALTGEFNILGYQPYNLSRPFSPYVFAGIATYKYNPKAKYQGDWVALQPLQTEGVKYSLLQFSIPLGLGAKYALNDKWNIGIEAGARLTFGDYLDDVSSVYVEESILMSRGGEQAVALANRSTGDPRVQAGDARGNPDDKDMYFLLGVSISYNFLDNGLVGARNRRRRSKSGCRTQ